ncbi:uncharacterized protein LOC117136796 isoform X1 [Drosophila mauritiana]|uniref:Uncharacterized protein LOC117136796 isoform X1 n=1 Tax=Drosophila mauritiana TaxID=7226 RepID=A0A6P8JLN1_DROMA|nr:uncharacterized protein LOC117136796 isoform X1 [Drosophila mauritiana]
MKKVKKSIKRASPSDEEYTLEEDPIELELGKMERGSSSGESDEEGQRDQKQVDSNIDEMDEQNDEEQEAAREQDAERQNDLRKITKSPPAGGHSSPDPATGEGDLRAEPMGSQGASPEQTPAHLWQLPSSRQQVKK